MNDRPWRPHGEGVRLAVRLTPRASRNGVDGIVRDAEGRPALQLRLCAPPVEGAANKALLAFVADALALRKADVEIVSGTTARHKLLQLSGDVETILARLETWVGA
jgi:uncharacterized protein (TIGR00251 family)